LPFLPLLLARWVGGEGEVRFALLDVMVGPLGQPRGFGLLQVDA
jgi:hypothetical protein